MTPEEWAYQELSYEFDYYYIDLYGKLSKYDQNKSFYDMCITDRSYTYFHKERKVMISSPLLIDDYSSYLKEIEELLKINKL